MFPWKQVNESGCGLVPHNGCRHRACSCWLMWGSRGVLCFIFYLGAKGRTRDRGKSLPAMQWNSTCLLGSLGTADQGEDLLPRWCPLVLAGDVELCPSPSSFPPPFPSSFQMVTPPRSSGVSPTQHTCKSWGSAAWCWLSGCQIHISPLLSSLNTMEGTSVDLPLMVASWAQVVHGMVWKEWNPGNTRL